MWQVLVVGGGYIGLECTAGLVNNGLEVTVVLPEDRVLSRLFTPKMAAFYEDFYQKKGVTFVKGSGVTAFEGTDGKVGAQLSCVMSARAAGSGAWLQEGGVSIAAHLLREGAPTCANFLICLLGYLLE